MYFFTKGLFFEELVLPKTSTTLFFQHRESRSLAKVNVTKVANDTNQVLEIRQKQGTSLSTP